MGTGDETHVKMLEQSPIMPGGLPYGVIEFGGDVGENPLCRRTAHLVWDVIDDPVSIMEIGSGGGRWTRFLHQFASSLLCVDATPAMIRHIEALRLTNPNPRFMLCTTPVLPGEHFDFIFSYDTLVHFDEDLFRRYLNVICLSVNPGAVVIIHHGSNEHKNPSQPTDYSGCWHCYGSDEVDSVFINSGARKVSEFFADSGFGSRVVCYKFG